MKSIIKYAIIGALITLAMGSCVKDEVYTDPNDKPDVQESFIKINEVMSNDIDPKPDWMELYNSSDAEIDLGGYILTDKNTEWTIPSGIKIASKGFVTFDCDGLDANGSTNFKISSGGEMVSLKDPDAVLIDQIDVPSFVNNVGSTYARIPDGESTWEVSTPTKGAANSNENNPPAITADTIMGVTDNARFTYTISVMDASGIADVKLFYKTSAETKYLSMAPIGGGQYTYTFPELTEGEQIEYYVEAVDNTGLKSYFSSASPDENLSFMVENGAPIFEEVNHAIPASGDSVTFNVKMYDKTGVSEVKLYYLVDDTDANNKASISLTTTDGGVNWTGFVPTQADGSVISYYLRAKDNEGVKGYYPTEDENFNHDIGTTWPTYAYLTYDAAIPTEVIYNQGPLTKLTFTSNPTPFGSSNIILEYDAAVDGAILEARVYFDVRSTPAYVKANKIKGENDPSFTQSGVTIDLANTDAEDENGDFSGNTSVAGTTVTFYVRIATANAEYYYGKNGVMYLDNTPGGGTTDDSDAFKADPSLWSSYLVQVGH